MLKGELGKMIWFLSIFLGVMTVAFAPLLITLLVKLLSSYARKYPAITDAVAVMTSIIIGTYLIAMSIVFATVYHNMIVNYHR